MLPLVWTLIKLNEKINTCKLNPKLKFRPTLMRDSKQFCSGKIILLMITCHVFENCNINTPETFVPTVMDKTTEDLCREVTKFWSAESESMSGATKCNSSHVKGNWSSIWGMAVTLFPTRSSKYVTALQNNNTDFLTQQRCSSHCIWTI